MNASYKITGSNAVRLAERDSLTIHTDSRLADGATTVSVCDARDIVRDDPESVWVSVALIGWWDGQRVTEAPAGYNVADYWTSNGMYLGPDDDGIEPMFVDAV